MARGRHNLRVSDADFDAIFERNHGAELRAYYARDPRSLLGSPLNRSCISGFPVSPRLHSQSGAL
jgi:hypothetical protein